MNLPPHDPYRAVDHWRRSGGTDERRPEWDADGRVVITPARHDRHCRAVPGVVNSRWLLQGGLDR